MAGFSSTASQDGIVLHSLSHCCASHSGPTVKFTSRSPPRSFCMCDFSALIRHLDPAHPAHCCSYLTLTYDWVLFGHSLSDRVAKGEEIMLFCFDFLKVCAMVVFPGPARHCLNTTCLYSSLPRTNLLLVTALPKLTVTKPRPRKQPLQMLSPMSYALLWWTPHSKVLEWHPSRRNKCLRLVENVGNRGRDTRNLRLEYHRQVPLLSIDQGRLAQST